MSEEDVRDSGDPRSMTGRRSLFAVGGLAAIVLGSVLGSVLVASPTAEAAPRSFAVDLVTFQFQPNVLRVDPGDILTIRVDNKDDTGHTFDITEFGISIPLAAGQNETTEFTADRQGVFWFFCAVPAHASRSGSGWSGMAGRLIVGPEPAADLIVPILAGIGVAAAVGVAAFIVLRGRKRTKP